MINIVFCIDDNFTSHCGVLMTSICENKGNENIHFHILIDTIKMSNEKLLTRIAKKYSQLITYYKVDHQKLENCPIRKDDHVSIAAYFRILIPLIIPDSVDKVLYLDCDIVVLSDLDDFWNTDIKNNAVGVVPDMFSQDIRVFNRLDYEMHLGYFNSGVLLMNLDYWRANNLSIRILDYIDKNPDKLIYWDQDALNYVLRNEKMNMPLRYNVQEGFYWQDPFLAKKYWQEMFKAAENPVILHYTGIIKPWYKECKHPKRDLYLKYLYLSPWHNSKIKHVKFKLRIRFLVRDLLILMGFMSNRSLYR